MIIINAKVVKSNHDAAVNCESNQEDLASHKDDCNDSTDHESDFKDR